MYGGFNSKYSKPNLALDGDNPAPAPAPKPVEESKDGAPSNESKGSKGKKEAP